MAPSLCGWLTARLGPGNTVHDSSGSPRPSSPPLARVPTLVLAGVAEREGAGSGLFSRLNRCPEL
jgi:hypothetical protein